MSNLRSQALWNAGEDKQTEGKGFLCNFMSYSTSTWCRIKYR